MLVHDLEAKVECPLSLFKEAFECICHSIIFFRALGQTTPQFIDSNKLQLTYTRVSCQAIINEISARAKAISEKIQLNNAAKFTITFSSPPKPSILDNLPKFKFINYFSSSNEPFEKWNFNIKIVAPKTELIDESMYNIESPQATRMKVSQEVRKLLLEIMKTAQVNSEALEIPKTFPVGGICYNYDIQMTN